MKIKEVCEDYIEFDNGNIISVRDSSQIYSYADNYADFNQLEELAFDVDFNENLTFEKCEYGFRFGNTPVNMFFIPCYSKQNGYYSSKIDVEYCDKVVISQVECDILLPY